MKERKRRCKKKKERKSNPRLNNGVQEHPLSMRPREVQRLRYEGLLSVVRQESTILSSKPQNGFTLYNKIIKISLSNTIRDVSRICYMQKFEGFFLNMIFKVCLGLRMLFTESWLNKRLGSWRLFHDFKQIDLSKPHFSYLQSSNYAIKS